MANFDSIIGQETAKKLLYSAVKNGRIAHAYLFIGPANLGKFKTALEFAKIIQRPKEEDADSNIARDRESRIEKGSDPDVLIIDPLNNDKENSSDEVKNISIEEIRKLEHHLSFFPYDSKYKIAIVNQAHKFTSEAVNAFLKTLEEPRGNSVIILIAENRHLLPATLVSRTETIR
jgi:DNA polymerase III gamma/tau subunit